ncbi:hypothetical protein [Nocardioides daeguensis]|uniref:hypothetical protein n=1 Tax=Nocardioides daeguensis TaxID=908359 RepID=UPI001C46530C|nr:hypothetical protein [Nocardioides daeguensis]MBV6726577.1 hypothetical protein [Nocardioides daeguensis]MBV6726579.1 hypothetical protein [Nocardioides daeguensis]MCR1774669.1 hypothetical protein [Nocardioides daeguensis]
MSTEEGTQARWEVRRAVADLEHVRRGPQRPLDHLRALRHAQEALNRGTSLMVDAARREGASWAQIGDALGISRQAVRQAAIRRGVLERERADAKQWHLPLPIKVPRIMWRIGRRSAA